MMLDNVGYKSKPTSYEIGKINNRITKNPVDISPEQLSKEVTTGKTFVPGYLNTKVNGQIKRRKENWTSQQIICLDFDDGMTLDSAKEEFKDTAMFIYTTFSHTSRKHKFRVVFATDKEIDTYADFTETIGVLMKKYPQVDQSCKDGNRMFYGGRELHVLNYENRIPVALCSDSHPPSRGVTNEVLSNKYIGDTYTCTTNNTNIDHVHNGSTNNVQYIINKNIKELHKLINPIPVTFYTYTEVYDYLNNQDLSQFLGVSSTSFNCVFHNDNKPSASIFYHNQGNCYVYKCFSDKSSCSFNTGTIRKCVERLLHCNKVESLNFLKEVYKVTLAETDWQKNQKEIIDENLRYIRSSEFEFDYPELHRRIRTYLGDLTLLHTIAKDNLPAEHYSDEQKELLLFASMRHLANLKGVKSHRRIANTVALFVYLGLVGRKSIGQIPTYLIDEVEKTFVNPPKSFNEISFFSLPSYSDEHLSFGEEKAIEFKEKSMTMKGWSHEMLFRLLGEDEAKRVYPQYRAKKLSNFSEENASQIEFYVMSEIEKKGWVIEKEIENNVVLKLGGKEFKSKQIKRMLGEMIDKYDLVRVRMNKHIKVKLGVEMAGSPFVITEENRIL